MSSPLTAFGTWDISFVHDGASHDIAMEPVGTASTADRFVVESAPYFWDKLGQDFVLYRAVNKEMAEVGRLLRKTGRSTDGFLVLDGRQVDRLVAILTAIGVLKRADSFRQ